MGCECGVIEKSGSWFSYNGERIGQGRDNARKTIESDPALLAELEEKIKNAGLDMSEETRESDELSDEDLDIRLLDLDGDGDE